MDQVTQQNAAMVEQSTAASHALAQETEELAQLAGRFRLGADAPAPAAARPARPVPALKVVGRSGRSRDGGAQRKPAPATAAHADEQAWEEF